MKLSILQIRQLIAEVFSEACMQEQVQIKQFAEALDIFRQAIEQGTHSLKCLDEISWNREVYGKEPYLQFMARFQKRYYQKLTDEMIATISAAFQQNQDHGFATWYNAYATGVVSWKDYVYHSLCNYRFPFTAAQQQEADELKKLNDFILESDWLAAFPFFEKLATDERLHNEHKSFFNLVLAEIIIYWKPAEDAFSYIEKAKELWPGSEDILITMGKYHVRKFEYEKGREVLFAAASRNKNKADVYSYIGDAYKDEQKYDAAREWYNKAADTNFLNASVYSKFFSLGGQQANKEEINTLIRYTEIIEQEDPVSPLLYNSYRDASFQFSTAGNAEEAINYCKKAIALKPQLQLAKIDLAYEYYKAGNKTEAIETAIAVMETDPANYNAWWALSYFYEMSGDIERAVNAYHKCIEIRPAEKAVIHNQLGYMLKGAEKWQEAIEHFQTAISEKPLVIYYENLKSVYEEMGDDEQVIAISKLLAEHPSAVNQFNYYNQLGIYFYKKQNDTEAIRYYQKAIEMKGNDPVLYENIGLAYEGADDISKAEEAYQKAASLEQEKGIYDNRLGYFYYMRAFKQTAEEEKQRYFGLAIDWYLRANEKELQNKTYISNIALAYEKMKQFTEAANWYRKILLLEDKNTEALSGVGFCSYMTGNYDDAVIHFNKAIEVEPWGMLFYDHLGYVYELQQNSGMAIDTYQKALQAIENYKEKTDLNSLKADHFHNRIGILLYNSAQDDQVRKSLDEYKKAIAVNPSAAVYHSNLALSYQYLAEYENAKESYKASVQLDPGNHDTYNSLGVMYYWLKQLPESIEAYANAIKLKTDSSVYYANIGLAYFDLKQYSEAEEYWLAALKLDPENITYMQNLKEVYTVTQQADKALSIDRRLNTRSRPD
jgi:tetratricopeptide (TPR) repeat protein